MNRLARFRFFLAPAAAAGLMISGLAQAGGVSYQYAPVISAEPVYETHNKPVNREVCWEERHYERESGPRSHTSTVVGAIIGGAVGSRFGGGRGKVATTAAGAALGGSIGRDAGRHNRSDRYYPVDQERCEIQRDYRTERVRTGYRVQYEYDGEVYETRTRHRPGDTIRVRVAVSPAD